MTDLRPMGASTAVAIPNPTAVDAAKARELATQIEQWCTTVDDVDLLKDTQARLSAVETYLRRKHDDASADIGRAARKLQLRIGQLIGPAKRGGDRGNQHSGGKSGAPVPVVVSVCVWAAGSWFDRRHP